MAIYLELLGRADLYVFLQRVDEEIAEDVHRRNCAVCGGSLYRANYPRKPRSSANLPAAYEVRLSFCCGREGCRRRATPPSVRFLGRRVYLGAVVLLCAAMQHGISPRRARELRSLIGVSEPTLRRWRAWWLDTFTQTPTWRAIRGTLAADINVGTLPSDLVAVVVRPVAEKPLSTLLRLLSPLTTQTCTL